MSRAVLCALAAASLAAAVQAQGTTTIVQQRLPDGRIVFSDRPQAGARTERQWTVEAETPAEAERRRDSAERNARATDELNARLARRLEQDRERDLQLEVERLRAQTARAERDAAQARAEALAQPPAIVVLSPNRHHRPPRVVQPPPRVAPAPRPGPRVAPRPGATPVPRPPGAPPERSPF